MYNVDILVWSQVQSEESEDKEKYSADVAVDGKWRKLEIKTFSRIRQKVIAYTYASGIFFKRNCSFCQWLSDDNDMREVGRGGCIPEDDFYDQRGGTPLILISSFLNSPLKNAGDVVWNMYIIYIV